MGEGVGVAFDAEPDPNLKTAEALLVEREKKLMLSVVDTLSSGERFK